MKKRAFLSSLGATAMAISGLVLGAAPASASIHNTPGYFHLMNAGSGKCIDATYPADGSAAYAQQWRCLNTAFEEWKYVPVTDRVPPYNRDVFQIVNGYTGQCLTHEPVTPFGFGLVFRNGDPVELKPCQDSDHAQTWYFGSLGNNNFQLLDDEAEDDPDQFCLDLENGDTSDGVPMQMWKCDGGTLNQRWTTLGDSVGGGGGGGGGCPNSTPSSAHPAAIRPQMINCP